jgi:BNR repeat-like domain
MRQDRTRRFAYRLTVATLAVGATAGCSGGSGSARHAALPPELVVAQRVDHLGALAREPMIVQHPSGALFVAGYPGGQHAIPQLWKSTDTGATWSTVDVGAAAQGAVGNSDVDLAIGPKGTVYFVAMDFDGQTGAGRGIAVGASADAGTTWSWTTLERRRFDDRPWVAAAPDGTAHVIWNDGHGIDHAVSTDRGKTWTHLPRISDHGGSSHFAAGPHGELAVRISPPSASFNQFDSGADFVAVSTDGGKTWSQHAPPAHESWPTEAATFSGGAIPRWVEPLAWDAAGNLYNLWTDSAGVWLARSTDRGATWTRWRVAEPPPHRELFYPYLVARRAGELAATWFAADLGLLASRPDSIRLRWHAALISVADSGTAPQVVASSALPTDAWQAFVVQGDTIRTSDPGGEYVGVTFLRAGGIAVATPIQDVRQAVHKLGFTFWRLEARADTGR